MKLKSMKDVEQYLSDCEEYEQKLYDCLDSLKKSKLSLKVKREKRKEIKERLEHIGSNIDYVLDLVTEYSTFHANLILPFICEFLNYSENDEFVLMGKVANEFLPREFNRKLTFRGIRHNILTTQSNAELLADQHKVNIFSDCDNLEEYLDILDDKRYIVLEKDKKYNLLDGMLIDERFEKFPKIKNIGYILVDLKLKHPELSDQQRLDVIRKGMNMNKQVKPKFYGLK